MSTNFFHYSLLLPDNIVSHLRARHAVPLRWNQPLQAAGYKFIGNPTNPLGWDLSGFAYWVSNFHSLSR